MNSPALIFFASWVSHELCAIHCKNIFHPCFTHFFWPTAVPAPPCSPHCVRLTGKTLQSLWKFLLQRVSCLAPANFLISWSNCFRCQTPRKRPNGLQNDDGMQQKNKSRNIATGLTSQVWTLCVVEILDSKMMMTTHQPPKRGKNHSWQSFEFDCSQKLSHSALLPSIWYSEATQGRPEIVWV